MKKYINLILFFLFIFIPFIGFSQGATTSTEEKYITESDLYLAAGVVVAAFGFFAVGFKYYIKNTHEKIKIDAETRFKAQEKVYKEKQDEVEQQFINSINEKKDIIEYGLDNFASEKWLLANTKICCIGEQPDKIRRVLDNVGFNLKNLLSEEEAKDGYDVLLINNEKGVYIKAPKEKGQRADFSEPIKIMEEKDSSVCFFYYNTSRLFFPNESLSFDLQHRLNFATNPAQIYGNLINTIKYQYKLKSKTKQA